MSGEILRFIDKNCIVSWGWEAVTESSQDKWERRAYTMTQSAVCNAWSIDFRRNYRESALCKTSLRAWLYRNCMCSPILNTGDEHFNSIMQVKTHQLFAFTKGHHHATNRQTMKSLFVCCVLQLFKLHIQTNTQ